jgi:hypothetical protein
MELTAFLCVTGGLGALLGLLIGLYSGDIFWNSVVGAVVTPLATGTALAVLLFLRESSQRRDPQGCSRDLN